MAAASSTIAELVKHISRTQVYGWKMPSSSEPGVPLVINHHVDNGLDTNTFYIYNFNKDKLRIVGNNITYGEYDAGNDGAGGPTESPNFLYTEYVDTKQSLFILANDSFQKKLVYQGSANVPLPVIGWSTDSKKIIFAIWVQDGHDEGGPTYKTVSYKIFNTADGSLITIPASENVTLFGFLDTNHILVEIGTSDNNITTAFNLDTMQLDQEWYAQKFGFLDAITKQNNSYSFSNGGLSLYGTKFAYGVAIIGSKGYRVPQPGQAVGEGTSAVIYGDLLNKTATTIAKGTFTQYQKALISPLGDKVAYEEEEWRVFPNYGNKYTMFWIYDSETGKQLPHRYENEVRIIKWLDDDKLLFESNPPPTATVQLPKAYNVLNISSNFVKKVWDATLTP